MKLTKTLTLNEDRPLDEQIRILDLNMKKLYDLTHNRIRFGTYTSGNVNMGENISGQYVSFTSHATPNTEFSVSHNIGAVPIGYIIMYQDKAASLYGTPTLGTAWTSSTVYFKCSVASVTFLVFLIK